MLRKMDDARMDEIRYLMEKYPDLPERAEIREWENLGFDFCNAKGKIFPEVMDLLEDGKLWINDAIYGAGLLEEELDRIEDSLGWKYFWDKRKELGLPDMTDEESDEMLYDGAEEAEMNYAFLKGTPEDIPLSVRRLRDELMKKYPEFPEWAYYQEWVNLGFNFRNEHGEIFPEVLDDLCSGKLSIDRAIINSGYEKKNQK